MRDAVAIVTGGGTGIGTAVVRRLAARGVRCVVNFAHSRDEAHALATEVGNHAVAVQADIVEDTACRALVAEAVERLGRLDFLVNNAGRTKHVTHEDLDGLDADDFIDIYRLNTVAAFQMARAAAPHLRAAGQGAIVNVASIAGIEGIGSSIAYAASKGAMITMTKSLARILAPAIRVNAVAPGYVGTSWFEKQLGVEGKAKLDQRVSTVTPLAIAPQAEEIAGPIEMLLDPAARAITGEIWRVDAGFHLDTGGSRRPGREV